MSIFSRTSLLTLVLVTLAVAVAGCSSSNNNDQGTSVTAIGFFADTAGEVGETGRIVPLFLDRPLFIPADVNGNVIPSDGALVTTFIGLQNRLTSQFIRVDRIDCSYTLPGADPLLVLPSDSFAIGAIIPGTDEDGDGVLAEQQLFAGFEILSPDLFAVINVNQNLLPQLPFRMVATCTAVVQSRAGDVFRTNTLNYTFQFVDAAECCTGDGVNGGGGFQVGTGTGGDFDSFGDPTPEGGGGAAAAPAP